MKTISILLFSLLTGNLLFAQHTKIVTAGSIEYEKSVNTYAINREILAGYPLQMQSMLSRSFDDYQRRMPQFAKLNSKLIFNSNKTLFTPIEANSGHPVSYLSATTACNQINTVYTDLATGTRVVQKQVFENQYLLTDSLSKIKWRLVDETQDIAGYTCRRANGVIQDSVYVVAFFTDKIWVSGGPESFSGLPGMILKLALPHEHITWTATKVTEEPPAAAIEPPKKGKPTTRAQLNTLLNSRGKGTMVLYEKKLFLL